MRTLKLSPVGTVIFALLGGLTGAVVAQTGPAEEDSPVTAVSGTFVSQVTDTSEQEWTEEGGIAHARYYKFLETIEWSDPRLPSNNHVVLNFDMYDGELREMPYAGTDLLVGEDGYWTGTFTGFCDQQAHCYGMDMLTGHGAYEGLFATLRAFPPEDAANARETRWEGLIYEGEMPPMPDYPEPPSRE
jgi:hypothetical protein